MNSSFQLADRNDSVPWIDCQVDSETIRMLIDSGADVNTISEGDWLKISEKYESNETRITDLTWGNGKRTLNAYASESPLQIEAIFKAPIRTAGSNKEIPAKFYVIRGSNKSLLGRDTAIALGVLRLGLEINECELKPQESAGNKAFPAVPDVLIHFEARLEEMQKQDIIEDVLKPARWVSGMSLVPKGEEDFRLVVNMKGPNRAITRMFYRLPTIDDMRVKLAGAKFFSKLDISSAFYHLVLDEESRELTTFQTETGLKRFKRLMFGVNCAPELFQQIMETKLKGIEGVIIFIDDVLIFAHSLDELRNRSEQVIAALERNNLTINMGKSEFEKTEIKFLGHQLSANGFNIDEIKTRAVKAFARPRNVTDLRSFLGLASYLSDYVPKFADLVAPLWECVKTAPFRWTQAADEAFASITTTLGYFDDTWETVLYTDASPYALGAVLTQEKEGEKSRIICFASKTLVESEKNYPHVQKEARGVVFGVEKHYYYLMGRKFKIRTDARGLAFIFNRTKETCKRALTRAEGWALRLATYNFEIEWIEGKNNIADPASRLIAPCIGSPREKGTAFPGEICELRLEIRQVGPISLEEIREETRRDKELTKVVTALRSDAWPKETSTYAKIKEELRFSDGILTRAGTIVIPESLRTRTLSVGHSGHPGRSAMKSAMRERVWWPGIPRDIDSHVTNCHECNLTSKPEFPVPMKSTTLPEEPWEKIAIDFNGPHARFGGKSVLVCVDYFSRFVIAKFLKSTDFKSVSATLGPIFQLLGNPRSIRSDNGPPFNSAEWGKFCNDQNIVAEFSTPGFPQQNGLVERYMQIVNKALTIAAETSNEPERMLEETVDAHNMATQRTTNASPEVLLFGRIRRRKLPVAGCTEVPVDHQQLRERDAGEKSKTRDRENTKRRSKPTKIAPGDHVLLKRHCKAKDQTIFDPSHFKVIKGQNGDFTIEAPNGKRFKRNVSQLKKVSGPPPTIDGPPPTETLVPRPKRNRQEPKHLSDYIHVVDMD
jgi:transposase InsO family protein